MSKLVICEKPSVAKSIASALGVTSRADGYFEGGGWLISWCIGHLVGLADAAAYDDRYKKWRYEDLPSLVALRAHAHQHLDVLFSGHGFTSDPAHGRRTAHS